MKHISLQRRPQQGYMLLESLISFVVVGVGILGATKLNTTILQSASASKARAEATALAQTTIENARNYLLPDGCSALTTPQSATTTTGVNAVYTISTTYTPQTEGTRVAGQGVNVTVSWGSEQIALSSAITCASPGTSAMVGDGGASNLIGNALTPPSGRAVVSGTAITGDSTTNSITDAAGKVLIADDGTRTVTNSTTTQLVNSAGKVLLTMKKLDCETAPPAFSTISGKIFIKKSNPGIPYDNLLAMPSDAGYCSITPYDDTTSRRLPANSTGNGVNFYYTYYKCYVGAGWYGNIGDVLKGNAANTAKACVGNPDTSATSNRFSAHPQLGNKRQYWGYGIRNGKYFTLGIGLKCTTDDCPSNDTCLSSENYTPQHYTNHHFVVGSGISNDTECGEEQRSIDTDENGALTGSPGRQFCMSPSESGTRCLEEHLTPLPSPAVLP